MLRRYRIYAEGFAWSVSLKYGMACGAVMLVIDPFFAAFYHPGLAYGTNALLVRRVPLCESFRDQVGCQSEIRNASPSRVFRLVSPLDLKGGGESRHLTWKQSSPVSSRVGSAGHAG